MSAISAGGHHTCALTTAGGVKCWGYNWAGELGDGTLKSRRHPTKAFGLSSGVSAISAGHSHTCALTTAGGVKCWGDNGYGELGDGVGLQTGTPRNVVLPGHLCPPAPEPSCRAAGVSNLAITVGGSNSTDLAWKWSHGQATNPSEFGNPLTRTRYELCVYDGTGLALRLEEIGWNCEGAKCWKRRTKGFSYGGKAGQSIQLIGSDEDKATIKVTSKGTPLASPGLPLVAPITVQWFNTSTPVCWGATYTAGDIVTNTAVTVVAKTGS